ncbi:MAG TPA: MFS transporter [Clostridia bacterium]|nr:MFS transporter [Clostridia bacterium]
MNIITYERIKGSIINKVEDSFPALMHRNFRYFWFGQCISLIGTWMQNAGQAWLVLKITDNAFLLGALNAAQFLPTLIFSLFAGVIVDRFPKRKVTIITQAGLMMCAFALTALIWTGHVKYGYILMIAVALGIFQSIDMPARQSFMVDLVGKEDLLNAVALNSSIFNAARIFGPALAGVVMAWLGAGAAFFINGLSFIAVIYGLFMIKVDDKSHAELSKRNVISNVLEGIKYISKTPILYSTVLTVGFVWVFCLNFGTLIPAFAKGVLGQEEIGYGALMSSMGLGAMAGALSLAAKSGRGPKYTLFLSGGAVLSVFMIVIGFQRVYILSAVFLMLAGWGMVTFTASANSILQINSPDNMRGRIMSVYALVSGGVVPFGSLYSGFIAERFGANIAFTVSGILGACIILLSACLFVRREKKGLTQH